MFRRLCERERCPYAVIGEATERPRLLLEDDYFRSAATPDEAERRARPIDIDLAVVLGKPPRMRRAVGRVKRKLARFRTTDVDIKDAVQRVLRLPAVADKSFLITIGDRTVGGLVARDQMVGPWQVPVADVGVTA